MTIFENPSTSTVVQEVPSYPDIPLCTGSEKRPPSARLKQFWLGEIDVRWTDLILLACTFSSGLVDGLAFNTWGSYVNMHTGNTLFIALSISGKPDYSHKLWIRATIAVVSFLLGNFFFIYYGRLLGPRRRIAVVSSFAIQTVFLLVTALLVQNQIISPHPDRFEPIHWIQAVAIALISFQGAGQLVASRFLTVPEIPTVVLTALVVDLLMDPLLYQRPWNSNIRRNRRVGAILTHFAGAAAAGGMVKHTGLIGGLWLCVGLKGAITLAFLGWNEKPPVAPKDVV